MPYHSKAMQQLWHSKLDSESPQHANAVCGFFLHDYLASRGVSVHFACVCGTFVPANKLYMQPYVQSSYDQEAGSCNGMVCQAECGRIATWYVPPW